MTVAELRETAKHLFQAAIDAADPSAALVAALGGTPLSATGHLYLIAVGKAAVPMMRSALKHVEAGTSYRAIVVTNYENEAEIDGAEVLLAGHPVPDQNGERAGKLVRDVLQSAGADDKVVALISGGGSALLPCPVEGVSLSDKAVLNDLLLSAGLDITLMNHVRQQISDLKGGGFLRHAAPAKVDAYILSDVVGDDLRVIASGPTVAPIGTPSSAKTILEDAGFWSDVPASIQSHLDTSETAQMPTPDASNTLICSNRLSLEAIQAAATGFKATIVDDLLEGNVIDVAPRLVEIARKAEAGPQALIFGGETTVTLTGIGRGGRNQDLALRFAKLGQDLPGNWVFLSGGTDGRDGPTDAAGGLVDASTWSRIKGSGHDPDALLDNNDSNRALAAANDLLVTGGTGTNVADVMVFLKN